MKKNKNSPIAFIAGVTGQDGANLAHLLLTNGYTVYGGYRRGGLNKLWRLNFLGITDQINLIEFHLQESKQIFEIFQKIQPDEIYNLAGESFVADSFNYPHHTMEINSDGVVNILDAAKLVCPNAKLFFASSSEIFGSSKKNEALNENSERSPCNPYGVSKLSAENFVRLYREKYGLFACSGILFSHEGPLRSRHFVTRKITFNLVRLKSDNEKYFELGSVNSARDWGSSIDYAHAMHSMIKADSPKDFVISSGQLTSVRQFFEISAKEIGFDPVLEGSKNNEVFIDKPSGRILAKVSPKYLRAFDTIPLLGNSNLIKENLGWFPTQGINDIVKSMVEADILRRKRGMIDI
jgi:GDPmannose 4,6-dehydratase